MSKHFFVAVDFDGTVVEHQYPEVGLTVPDAVPILKEFVELGMELILNTMRSGEELEAAVLWFHDNKIPLFGVNYNKTQESWTASPKVYAHIYIDDAAAGCPLEDSVGTDRPRVSWMTVRSIVLNSHGKWIASMGSYYQGDQSE